MKIIDLLNKIANGEDVPKRIKYLGRRYNYDYEDVCYYDDDKRDLLEYALINCKYTAVNEEIKILDEPKVDKIEKLEKVEDFKFVRLIDKINELIDEVNQLKEEK